MRTHQCMHMQRHGEEGSQDCAHNCRLQVRTLLFQSVVKMGGGSTLILNPSPSPPPNYVIAGSDMKFGEKYLYGPRIKPVSMTVRCTISIQAIYGTITISNDETDPTGT